MKTIDDDDQIFAYAKEDRPIEVQRPTEKHHGKKGETLYWLPVGVLDLETRRNLDLVMFSVEKIGVRAFDVLKLSGIKSLQVYGGKNPISLYYCKKIQVLGNMLDGMRAITDDIEDVTL